MQGAEVAGKIKATARWLEAEHERIAQQLAAQEQHLGELTQQRQQAFLRLAEIYLPELGDEGAHLLRDRLPEMQHRIEAIIHEKRQDLAEVDRQIAESTTKRRNLEASLEKITARVEERAQTRETLRAQVAEELKGDPAHGALLREIEQMKEQLLQAQRRLDAARQEREEKSPAYEQNELFRYLLRRRYATEQYRPRMLTRRLDAWVAGLVDYDAQIRSYRLLREVSEVMKRDVDATTGRVEEKLESLAAMEQTVEDRVGLTALLEGGERLYQERVALLGQIEDLDKNFEHLIGQRREFDDNRGRYYGRALQEYREFLEGRDATRLKALARSTETRADDGFVARIEGIDAAIVRTRNEIEELHTQRDEKAQKLHELRELDRTFHRHDYDASNSYFEGGFDIEKLLEGFLVGIAGLSQVLATIRRFQRFRAIDYGAGAILLAEILRAIARSGAMGPRHWPRHRGPWRGAGRGFGGGRRGGFGGFGGGGSRTTGGFG